MSRHQQIECELLKRAIQGIDPQGYAITWGPLEIQIRETVTSVEYGDVMDALNRLLESGAINARKYGLNTADNRDYQKGKDNEATFFYTGTFYLKKTPYSKPYLEQIEEPPEPEKRRIGF